MKRILQYIMFGVLLWGCIDDNSKELYPENNPNFSNITITSPSDTISVDLGQAVSFKPTISQEIEGKALSYRWTANTLTQEGVLGKEFECGTAETLDYMFMDKGLYKLKLEVKNEDYSEVKSWVMEVRAYDRGYFVVGNDDNTGTATISFGRELSASDILEGKQMTFAVDIMRNINPEYDMQHVIRIAKSIISYGKSEANLHVFTRDKIYVADPETFEIFWVVDFVAAFPGETIVEVAIMDTYATTAYILTSKNRLLGYNKAEFGLYEVATGNLSGQYADAFYADLFTVMGSNMNLAYYWVKDNKVFTNISYFEYYGGTNPANNTMAKVGDVFVDGGRANEYDGYDILGIFNMNGDYYSGQNNNAFSVCREKVDQDHYMIVEFTAGMNGFETVTKVEFDCPDATYREGTRLVPNGRYNSVYYADGANVYVWYPKNVAPNNKFPSKAAFNLGEGKEVTFMRVSYDMRELYVGFYDRNSGEALKGGFYIYDASKIGVTANLQPTKKFENITSRPTDIIYKSLAWDIYKPQ